ncbi:tyrosine-protein phosphatase [candidate division KSB1 bacterium]|nr:tyrosine-protein phosphatase [candidate division KSB1 bacterium]
MNKQMALDYWNPDKVVNFRDVGGFINLIADRDLMPAGRLYRGGALQSIRSLDVVNNPKTIFNLRKRLDPLFPHVATYHFPISNDYEKYETSTPEVRAWLQDILAVIEAGIEYPLYVHCLSGKDRTGIVIAVFLSVLGIPREYIIEEYLLSDGDVSRPMIEMALDGISPIDSTLKRIDLQRVKLELLGPHI